MILLQKSFPLFHLPQTAGAGGRGKQISVPKQIWEKAQTDPKVMGYLQDTALMEKFSLFLEVQQRLQAASQGAAGNAAQDEMMSDPQVQAVMKMTQTEPRIMELMMVMMGQDLDAQETPFKPSNDEERTKKRREEEAKKKADEEAKRLDERSDETKAGDALKDEGNALYKEKKFDEAIAKYDEAIVVQPNEIT